jgi:hypothetical protein
MNLSISNVTLGRSFVGGKGCIISRVIDMKNVSLDLSIKDVLGIERKVF